MGGGGEVCGGIDIIDLRKSIISMVVGTFEQ